MAMILLYIELNAFSQNATGRIVLLVKSLLTTLLCFSWKSKKIIREGFVPSIPCLRLRTRLLGMRSWFDSLAT